MIIPAHNEQGGIARLLRALSDASPTSAHLDVTVVCNGCTDRTADVARGFDGVRVLETPEASKWGALRLGDGVADGFPRLYVDADVEIGRSDVEALTAALEEPGVLAAAPRRVIPRDGGSLPVRWYYDVWEELPHVEGGIFGRGVIALSRAGFDRVSALPALIADDLAVSAAFADVERRVVESAVVVVHPPRTWADLLRRRVRAATGTAQLYEGQHETRVDARTSRADLVAILRRRPGLAVKMPVFLAVAVLARREAAAARNRGDTTWLRDESSRS